MRKWIYEEIKSYVESYGYKLLSDEYVNNRTKILLRCPKGHEYYVVFLSFKQGHRCQKCKIREHNEKGRLSYNHVKNYIENYDYILLSEEYERNIQKLRIKCPEEHVFEMSFNNFRRGQRCLKCKIINSRNSYKKVKEIIEKEDYVLLSSEYKRSGDKLQIKCPEGHIFWMSLGEFQQGNRCSDCFKTEKLEYKEVRKTIESEGYILLSQEYNNVHEKLKLKCPKDHICWISYAKFFFSGRRCKFCSREIIAQKKRVYSQEDFKNYIEKEGYILLSHKEIDFLSRLKLMCPSGHIYEVVFKDFWNNGHRCPKCRLLEKTSLPEKELQNFVNHTVNNVVWNDRSQITNPETNYKLELDIWVPDLKKAIEFNGKYWHSLERAKKNDKVKQEQCKEQGIDLMVINEQDWIKDKSKVLKAVGNFLQEK